MKAEYELSLILSTSTQKSWNMSFSLFLLFLHTEANKFDEPVIRNEFL